MNVRNWNLYSKVKKNIDFRLLVSDNASLWISIGLLWLSFTGIIKEHFGRFLYIENQYQRYDGDLMQYISRTEVDETNWWLIFVVVFLLWIPVKSIFPQAKKLVCMLPSLGAAVVLGGFCLFNWKDIYDGTLSLFKWYLVSFNLYHGVNFQVMAGYSIKEPTAFTVLMLLLWAAVWGLSKLWKKRVVLVLFPLVALGLELMVGKSPMELGLLLAFVAFFLLLVPEGASGAQHVTAMLIVVVALIFCDMGFAQQRTELLSKAQELQTWVKEFDLSKFQFQWGEELAVHSNTTSINNRKPNYRGEVMLQMEATIAPSTNLYLREFCATSYANGTWSWNYKIYDDALRYSGYDKKVVTEAIAGMPREVIKHSLNLSRRLERNRYTIYFKALRGNTALTPYIFGPSSMGEGYSYIGDYIVKKNFMNDKVELLGSAYGDLTDLCYSTPFAVSSELYKYIHWYNEVAANYGVSSTDLSCIKEAAAYVKMIVPSYNSDVFYGWIYGSVLQGLSPADKERIQLNLKRVHYAQEVAKYLDTRIRYSTNLDTLPVGADPIEYAMTESKEGYCMHFASAATLILKELGVPARYASGYVVRPSDFKWDSTIPANKAEITDYAAHAWVEIYLDDIGWLPVEVTPGYTGGGALPTVSGTEEAGPSESESTETETTPTETETDTEPTEAPDDTEEPSETEDSETESESETLPEETEEESEAPGEGNGQIQQVLGDMLRILIWAAAVAAVVFAVLLTGKYYEKLLKLEVKKKNTRKAVTRIHRRTYYMLRIRAPYLTSWSDGDVEEALVRYYPQLGKKEWARYMEIVKKMHYSKESISEEEMMFCYYCYEKRKAK